MPTASALYKGLIMCYNHQTDCIRTILTLSLRVRTYYMYIPWVVPTLSKYKFNAIVILSLSTIL